MSEKEPDFADATPMAQALVAANPDRIVWGTDWPHPNVDKHMPDDGQLVDLIAEIAPNETTRRRMLVDNPAKLFGFAQPSS